MGRPDLGGRCRPKKAYRPLERPSHDSKGGGKCQLQEGHDLTEVLKRSFWDEAPPKASLSGRQKDLFS